MEIADSGRAWPYEWIQWRLGQAEHVISYHCGHPSAAPCRICTRAVLHSCSPGGSGGVSPEIYRDFLAKS